jgi:hypothetical protein
MSRASIAIGLLAAALILPIWSANPVRAQELPPVVSRRSSPVAAYPPILPARSPRTVVTPLTENSGNGLYLRLADQASAEELPLSQPTPAANQPATNSTGSSATGQSSSQPRAPARV